MIEPDVVPPGDGSGGTGPLADQGKRVAWSTDVLKPKSFPVNQDKSSIKIHPCISMILTNKVKGFERIRYYWVSYINLVPGPSKHLENSGNIPIILRTCGNFDGLEGLRYVDTWDTQCLLVLIHGFWEHFYRKPGFPIEISGFRFQFCLKPIHWLISSFGGASNAAKEGLSGPSDGWSWTMSWVKIRQQHLSKSLFIPFSTCSRFLDDGFGSGLVKCVANLSTCGDVVRVSNAYIYHSETLQIGTLLKLHMLQSSLLAGGTTRPVAEHRGWKGSPVSWCHGVLRSIQELLKRKLRITNRDTTPFDLYLMISIFLGVSFTCSRLWSIKDTAVPWSLVQIHLPGTSRSGRGKGQIGRRRPRWTWVLKSRRIPSRHHGWMTWIIFRDKTGNLHCTYCMTFRFSVPYPSKLLL